MKSSSCQNEFAFVYMGICVIFNQLPYDYFRIVTHKMNETVIINNQWQKLVPRIETRTIFEYYTEY